MAAKIARDANVGEENQEYYVLMVATDGVITDMQQTISSIVNASDLPLSIVIVGVGNADFDKMDVLVSANPSQPCGARLLLLIMLLSMLPLLPGSHGHWRSPYSGHHFRRRLLWL